METADLKIFLSYRRNDDFGHARALYNELERHFAPQNMFWDVETGIRPGAEFPGLLRGQVEKAGVVLVVIGKNWLAEVNARLTQMDYVVMEVSLALSLQKWVIPVLVGGGAMPGAAELPEPIRTLCHHHAVVLRPERFRDDCTALIEALRARATPPREPAMGRGPLHPSGRDPYGQWQTLDILGVPLRLRRLDVGTFVIGSPESEPGRLKNEGPQREVTIAQPFHLAETPCTQALWEAVMEANPSRFKHPARPVESVAWGQCQDFLSKLNDQFADREFRLPSEQEWEYACRAGTTAYAYATPVHEIAWYRANSNGTTQVVGQKAPNAWGLYDMLGNVWEWCADRYRDYDGSHLPKGTPIKRVLRGGSWQNIAHDIRAAMRTGQPPDSRGPRVGFRICLTDSETLPSQLPDP